MGSVYEIDSFALLILKILEITTSTLLFIDEDESKTRSRRIIADHVKAATFIMAEKAPQQCRQRLHFAETFETRSKTREAPWFGKGLSK